MGDGDNQYFYNNYNYNKYAVILGVSEATIKRRIKQLKEKGKIVRKGANKNGYWQIEK